MTEDSRLILRVKKWLSAHGANLQRCRCLLVRLVHQKYASCTQKGLLTHIFYPVKQQETDLPGIQNYAHQKQLPSDN